MRKYTCSSFPSVTIITTLPSAFRPVLPILCIIRIGDLFDISKHTIKLTSPISKPSSPIEVEIRVLHSSLRNAFITCICCFCVIEPWPKNILGFILGACTNRHAYASVTLSLYSQNTITRLLSALLSKCCKRIS